MEVIFLAILFSLTITGLEVTLNTQLDQKLEELKNNQKSISINTIY